MIQSTSSTAPMGRNDPVAAATTSSAGRASTGPSDQIHIDKAASLWAGLQQVPEIRPEVVERARALAADPGYPSDAIIRHISAAVVHSPDLSEDNS